MDQSRTNSQPLVSAALIVRDEGPYLEGCLQTLNGIADEIVVVDTGSVDNSKEIALHFGARVFDHPWTSDFSAARNVVLDLCKGQWILWIDADERLRPISRTTLLKLLSDESKAAYYVLFHRRPGFTPNWQTRLFRNHPVIRFVGKVHENIYPGIDFLCRTESKQIGYGCLVFDHFGYEGDQNKRARRNLPLLLGMLKHEPERIFMRCHLARTYEVLGENHLADEAWMTGIEIVLKKNNRNIGDSFPHLGAIESEIRKGRHPAGLVAEGHKMFPRNLQVCWYQASLWLKEGRHQEALPLLEQIIDCGRTNDFDHSIGYDRRLFNDATLEPSLA
jgi:glycosyltransferase involved in cell wall biosynthesis